jgi:hypothetical protein
MAASSIYSQLHEGSLLTEFLSYDQESQCVSLVIGTGDPRGPSRPPDPDPDQYPSPERSGTAGEDHPTLKNVSKLQIVMYLSM